MYRWDVLAASRFEWWVERFRAAFQDFDILRIDHFRGFESYWEIPAGAENAIGGQWKPGPGAPLFDAVRTALGDPAIVAEDLGLITDAVHALREHLGFPGMRVLQFGCDSDEDPFHRPDQYPENSVVYTGTHDNDTVIGWYEQRRRSGANMDIVQRFLSGNPDTVHLDLISAVLNSRAHTAVIPLQDLLGLGSDSRNNTPGLAAGNWQWRCSGAADFEKLASMMRTMTESTQRLPAAAA
ncbi:MAG: 4-alpha-glucanotransferase [Planctomycetaceae bacterium]